MQSYHAVCCSCVLCENIDRNKLNYIKLISRDYQYHITFMDVFVIVFDMQFKSLCWKKINHFNMYYPVISCSSKKLIILWNEIDINRQLLYTVMYNVNKQVNIMFIVPHCVHCGIRSINTDGCLHMSECWKIIYRRYHHLRIYRRYHHLRITIYLGLSRLLNSKSIVMSYHDIRFLSSTLDKAIVIWYRGLHITSYFNELFLM